MTLGFLYRSDDNAMWFTFGFMFAIVGIVVLCLIGMAADEWKKFKEYKQQKPNQPTPDVVDAHFVNKPHTTQFFSGSCETHEPNH